MKRFLLFLLLPVSGSLSASSFYEQLFSLNRNWSAFAFCAPTGEAHPFNDERSYIQAHLCAVENVLRQTDVSSLRETQRLNRAKNLDVLHAYWQAGSFPQNEYRADRTPVFIDASNTHCAVGYLMQQSGNEALARRISNADNYVYVKNITDPALHDWQTASGFSVEELALIQPAYAAPPTAFEQAYACTTVYFRSYQFNGKGGDGPDIQPGEEKMTWYSGECANGTLNGKWVQYHSPGVLWIEGEFTKGKKSGTWTRYTAGAQPGKPQPVSSVEHWDRGLLHGLYVAYDYSGKPSEQGYYVNGKKEGEWKRWQAGFLLSMTNYINGEKDGDCFQYYIDWNDSTKHAICLHDVYYSGVPQSQRWNWLDGRLKSTKELLANGLYDAIEYGGDGKITMRGTEEFYLHKDSMENMMYPNLPKTYSERELYRKTGRWVIYAPYQHYLVQTVADSALLYCENDSVRAIVSYPKGATTPSTDSLVYHALHPFVAAYYWQPNAAYDNWHYDNGKVTLHIRRSATGALLGSFQYSDGKLVSGTSFYTTGQYRETWTHNSNRIPLDYRRYNETGNIIVQGQMTDTLTRAGDWKFYDKNGRITGMGAYENNLKEGKWQETRTNDGTIWVGEYHKGKKTGAWKQIWPEVGIRYEQF